MKAATDIEWRLTIEWILALISTSKENGGIELGA